MLVAFVGSFLTILEAFFGSKGIVTFNVSANASIHDPLEYWKRAHWLDIMFTCSRCPAIHGTLNLLQAMTESHRLGFMAVLTSSIQVLHSPLTSPLTSLQHAPCRSGITPRKSTPPWARLSANLRVVNWQQDVSLGLGCHSTLQASWTLFIALSA